MTSLRMDPKVFVVVLNWRRSTDTIDCVQSLLGTAYQRVEIVIVDNASGDGSVARLTAAFSKIPVIENSENLGYAGGNNIGIRYALEHGADYVLLLNNDTIVDRNVVQDLVAAAESDGGVGIVGPKIYDYHEPETIWFAGAMIDWSTGESPHIGLGERDRGQYEGRVEVDRLTGCAMMVRREVFERVGVLDPSFFLYYEDVDFCLRARSAGYQIVCARNAKVWHKVSSSTKANRASALHRYYHTRNRLMLLRKYGRLVSKDHRKNIGYVLWYLARLVRRPFADRALDTAELSARIDFYRGRCGIKPRYHEIGHDR